MLQLKRLLTQLCAALLYNANYFSPRRINAGSLCVPGLNCSYCPGALAGCPLGALQGIFASGLTRLSFYLLSSAVLAALLLGRLICGWLCPFGLLQELLYKLPSPKAPRGSLPACLIWCKYLVLAAVCGAPLWFYYAHARPLPVFCEYLCPNGLVNALIMIAADLGFGFGYALINSVKIAVTVLVLLSAVFVFRSFCRFFCPLGAFYALFQKISVFAVQTDAAKCTGCGACLRLCPMECKKVGGSECIACGRCASACPARAISCGLRQKYKRAL